MVYVVLGVFWIMQAGAQIFFKLGALHPDKHVLHFILGNIVGASSTALLIVLYKLMAPGPALALAGGGAFVAAQLALVALFRAQLNLAQYGAMMLIAAGMALFALAGKTEV